MRTLLMVGSIVAGVVFFLYEYYKERPDLQNPHQRSRDEPRSGGDAPHSEDEFIEINSTSLNVPTPGKKDDCPICLDPLYSATQVGKVCIVALPGCGHWFHRKCAYRLLDYHPMCPVCRIRIDPDLLRGGC